MRFFKYMLGCFWAGISISAILGMIIRFTIDNFHIYGFLIVAFMTGIYFMADSLRDNMKK